MLLGFRMMLNAQFVPVETLAACFTRHRRRLERMLDRVVRALADGEVAAARNLFPAYDRTLRAYMQFEEDRVFPLLEMWCHAEAPVCVLRNDQRDIERRLDALSTALAHDDLDDFRAEYELLVDVLDNHNGRKERVLYPAIDRALDDQTLRGLVEELHVRCAALASPMQLVEATKELV